MRWIWNNKEWLFSGAAVAVIAGAIGLFYRRFPRRPAPGGLNAVSADRNGSVIGSPQASGSNINQTIHIGDNFSLPQPGPITQPYSQRPSPDEIRENLEKLPVYQRALTKDSFLGLKVLWEVVFTNLESTWQGRGADA